MLGLLRWKTTYIFSKIADDLYFSENGKWKTTSDVKHQSLENQPLIFQPMEDNLHVLENGRRPQFFRKWKRIKYFGKAKIISIC